MLRLSFALNAPFYLGFFSPRIVQRLVLVLLSVALLSPALTDIARAIEPSDAPEFITTFGSPGGGDGQFNYPKDIATDSAGNLYVADTANGRIQKFSSNGTFLMQWGDWGNGNGEFGYIEGIAADSAGNVYVSDTDYHRIQKFDSNGTYLAQWGTFGSGDGQFNYPYGITVDSVGNVYVVDSSNQRIQKFSSTGTYLSQFGGVEGSGDGQFFYPNGIAIDQSGNFYVADVGNKRIQKFDFTGTYLTQWGTQGSGNGQFQAPTDVAIDASGNIYVADTNNHRIQKLSSIGTYLTQWGTQGSGNDQFVSPEGMTIDPAGNLYIVDNGNERIQKFGYPKTADIESPSGSQEIQLATPAATDINHSAVVAETSLEKQDQSNTFPLGLVDFELTVPTGSTQQISLTFVTDLTPGDVTVRKYHSTNKTYSDVPGATVTETTLGGKHALLLTYDIADGGSLDDDGLVNGLIVDPVGLAVATGVAAPGAPDSGAGVALSLPILASMIVIPVLAYAVQKRRSRR